ncbi:MAG: transpeptidase [Candidatus Pelagibacter sp.]|nr:transpeptidase [Candidatus Pelagibacter sp.]OUW67393.1 MAG: transpeptidase [Candidatus Pelagibacter sp. TMED202]|tara:strand:- start:1224 stop:1715 length:492 start_codon:yes stop_codon:yes gene_type:complete
MDIILKKKFIYLKDYKAKCAIGKRGITNKKFEGDKCTPRGRFKLKYIFYRKERIKKISTKLKLIPIKENFGWCDDVKSNLYNKFIKFPFKYRAEKLYLKDSIYDIIIVIDYNLKPIKKNRGSAIFLHIAKKNYSPTSGCVAISKVDLIKLLKILDKNTFLNIL